MLSASRPTAEIARTSRGMMPRLTIMPAPPSEPWRVRTRQEAEAAALRFRELRLDQMNAEWTELRVKARPDADADESEVQAKLVHLPWWRQPAWFVVIEAKGGYPGHGWLVKVGVYGSVLFVAGRV